MKRKPERGIRHQFKMPIKLPSRSGKKQVIKSSGIVDKSGLPVPPEIAEFWIRSNQIGKHAEFWLQYLINRFERADESEDLAFRMVDRKGVIAALKTALEEAECIKSEYVCPSCNGILFADCGDCQKRGAIAKKWWKLVPEEKRKVREL